MSPSLAIVGDIPSLPASLMMPAATVLWHHTPTQAVSGESKMPGGVRSPPSIGPCCAVSAMTGTETANAVTLSPAISMVQLTQMVAKAGKSSGQHHNCAASSRPVHVVPQAG